MHILNNIIKNCHYIEKINILYPPTLSSCSIIASFFLSADTATANCCWTSSNYKQRVWSYSFSNYLKHWLLEAMAQLYGLIKLIKLHCTNNIDINFALLSLMINRYYMSFLWTQIKTLTFPCSSCICCSQCYKKIENFKLTKHCTVQVRTSSFMRCVWWRNQF